MTLVLLLTAATGAWAESKPIGLNVEYAVGDVITTNSTTDVYVYYGEHPTNSKQMAVKITSTQPLKISMITAHSFELNGAAAVYYLPDGELTTGSAGAIPCVGESTGDATVVHVASGSGTLTDPYVFGSGPSGTPVPITWDATAKTATIAAMPAGNVTVKVKYFAQAEFAKSIGETPELLAPTAINDVPATTDGAIVKAGTVANIGQSEVKQGTLMYFVSQSTGNTAPEAPDYDAEGWSEDVPTANGLAQGKAYVWYYIKGAEPAQVTDRTDANTCSDSDIMPLGTDGFVTLAAEPTYYVSLNKTGMAEGEPAKWSAKSTNVTTAVNLGTGDLEGVKKGETVTVTYTGTKKVLGVKAEKKAAAPAAAEGHALSASVVGEIVGTDGKAYAAADKDNLPEGVTAVAMIAYVGNNGEDAPYNHGLALALTDESSSGMKWEAAKTACNTTKNTSIPVTNARWLLASKDQWGYMSSAVLSNLGLQDQGTKYYWSSTTDTSLPFLQAWAYHWSDNGWELFACSNSAASNLVRACLAF